MTEDIYVYLFDSFDGLDEGFIERNLERLPDFRREQCLKYRRAEDKICCIAAYLLLEKGLQEQYCIPSPGFFVYNQNGKPYLQDHPEIFFNMSHCASGVVCALSKIEIGVDIQNPTSYDQRLAERVCNVAELQRLAAADDPVRLFCEMWTKKESYAKAKGMGVADVLKKTLPEYGFWSLHRTDYCLSVYYGKSDANVFWIKAGFEL